MLMFKKSILAGIVVSIGAYNYTLNHDLLSKILFPIALIVILAMDLNLYTSKVGKLFCERSESFSQRMKSLGTILAGNLIACMIMGYLFSLISTTHAPEIWAAKLDANILVTFFKAIIVGILMQVAVFSRKDIITMGAILLFLCTNTEHSIADVVYMSLANAFSIESFVFILVCIVGNAIGSCIVYFLSKDKL